MNTNSVLSSEQKYEMVMLLLEVWQAHPLRLGQIIHNSLLYAGNDDLFNIEDKALIKGIQDFDFDRLYSKREK